MGWCGSGRLASPRPPQAFCWCGSSPWASTATCPPPTPPAPRRASHAPSDRAEGPRVSDTGDTACPRLSPGVLADDGDALTFCSTCAFSQACLSQGMDKASLMDLHMLVEHVGPLHAGEHVFRVGDPFEAIAAVRAGTVKTYVVDRDGRERSEEHTSELQSLMRIS